MCAECICEASLKLLVTLDSIWLEGVSRKSVSIHPNIPKYSHRSLPVNLTRWVTVNVMRWVHKVSSALNHLSSIHHTWVLSSVYSLTVCLCPLVLSVLSCRLYSFELFRLATKPTYHATYTLHQQKICKNDSPSPLHFRSLIFVLSNLFSSHED